MRSRSFRLVRLECVEARAEACWDGISVVSSSEDLTLRARALLCQLG